MFTFALIADKLRGQAGATWGYGVRIYREIHRSGKMSVNHIMYILVYTEQYSAKHIKLGTLFLVWR